MLLPDKIYLLPGTGSDGETTWCDHNPLDAESEVREYVATDTLTDVNALRAAAKLAEDKLAQAMARFMNRHSPVGEAGSPERREWVETLGLVWEASILLNPGAAHPDDATMATHEISAQLAKSARKDAVMRQMAEALDHPALRDALGDIEDSVAPESNNLWEKLVGWMEHRADALSAYRYIFAYPAAGNVGAEGTVFDHQANIVNKAIASTPKHLQRIYEADVQAGLRDDYAGNKDTNNDH